MSSSIEEIRVDFAKALKDTTLNIDKIIELSNKLAQADPNQVRFSTDAGIISRLGRELVAKQETAVSELIKNAYDADATEVIAIFKEAFEPGGTLTIEDNGVGMTREQLISGFMRLSSSDKIDNPTSPIYSRSRAGRKGIGRFAVQRLGKSLTIITQTTNNPLALKIEIDWGAFISGKDLISITSNIQTVPKEREKGTTLTISDLSEGWNDTEIRRVYRYITELIQPYPLHISLAQDQTNLGKNEKVDPGFQVKIWRSQNNENSLIADEQKSIFSHALAQIEGYVDESGKGYWQIDSDKYEIHQKFLPIGKDRQLATSYSNLVNVSIKAYYYIWAGGIYPRSIYSSLKESGIDKSGIRLYRNGFRVPPYGERQDDWLGLDASTSNRDILPPHANINFIGYVEVLDSEGLNFEETLSREGLIENEAFKELQDFCSRVLKAAALRIAEARNRKQTRNQRNWEKEKGNPSDVIKGAAERLKTVVEDQKNKGKVNDNSNQNSQESLDNTDNKEQNNDSNFFEEAVQLAEEILEANELRNQKDQILIQELGMLRVLASLGLTIGEFTHEVRQTLDAAKLDAKYLANILKEGSNEHRRAIRLESNVQRFTTYAAYFDKAIQENISRELVTQDLRVAVNKFVDLITPTSIQIGIEVSKDISGYDLLTPPMHASELASILFNFYSNAQKAIKRSNAAGKINIRVGADGSKLFLEFSDNGDGIPIDNQERIFDAFFTTSTPAGLEATDEEEMQGTGLGLKIVKDIVEGYNGEVYISSPPKDFSTCIRVELPLYNDN